MAPHGPRQGLYRSNEYLIKIKVKKEPGNWGGEFVWMASELEFSQCEINRTELDILSPNVHRDLNVGNGSLVQLRQWVKYLMLEAQWSRVGVSYIAIYTTKLGFI